MRLILLAFFVGASGFIQASAPAAADAHGISGRADLPLPAWLFGWAAAAVLVISFAALALLWRAPKLEKTGFHSICKVGIWVDWVCGAIGVLVFGAVIYSGFIGTQSPAGNIAPTFIYVFFWVGLVPISVIFGNVFNLFNPWRAVARFISWIATGVLRQALPQPLPYPKKLGYWPAVIGLFGFAWLELVYAGRDIPALLSLLALLYAVIQWIGMGIFGIDRWTKQADSFSVYFGLFASMSPIFCRRRQLGIRKPLSGLTELPQLPGILALLTVMIGATTFDGASNGPLWAEVAPALQKAFLHFGLQSTQALQVAFTLGLIASITIVWLLFRIGIAGIKALTHLKTRDLTNGFVHSLVPIALAYALAHYISLLIFQGQTVPVLASDPLGSGGNLFGTASWTINYNFISANTIWYVQVAALVLGHIGGLVLAHDRAISLAPQIRIAVRSQYWLLAVMVGYTCLGLWLLASVNS